MEIIELPGMNFTYAKDQPEYLPLPVRKFPKGETIACYELSDEDLAEMNRTRKMYISQWTFNGGYQPIRPALSEAELYPEELEPITSENLKPGDKVILSLHGHKFGTVPVIEVVLTHFTVIMSNHVKANFFFDGVCETELYRELLVVIAKLKDNVSI